MIAPDLQYLFQGTLIFSTGIKLVTCQPTDKKITVSSFLRKQYVSFRQEELSLHINFKLRISKGLTAKRESHQSCAVKDTSCRQCLQIHDLEGKEVTVTPVLCEDIDNSPDDVLPTYNIPEIKTDEDSSRAQRTQQCAVENQR